MSINASHRVSFLDPFCGIEMRDVTIGELVRALRDSLLVLLLDLLLEDKSHIPLFSTASSGLRSTTISSYRGLPTTKIHVDISFLCGQHAYLEPLSILGEPSLIFSVVVPTINYLQLPLLLWGSGSRCGCGIATYTPRTSSSATQRLAGGDLFDLQSRTESCSWSYR